MSPYSYLENLNSNQRQAVVHPAGPILVVAGAGSGKTRVLTLRIAYLIDAFEVRPGQILALTFTNKAAGEMKERALQSIPQGYRDLPWVGTFHSFCLYLLRRFHREAGLPGRFFVLDRDDQISVVRHILKESQLQVPKSLRGWVAAISGWKQSDLSPQDVIDSAIDSRQRQRAEVYHRYQTRLAEIHAVDFDDLLLRGRSLLRDDERVKNIVHWQYEHILVDEFQDINGIQFDLISLLAGSSKKIMVVGDDDQSIYSWRGASADHFQMFIDSFKPSQIVLEVNYRSTPQILEVADKVIAENPHRVGKNLTANRPDGDPVHIKIFAKEHEEAQYVSRVIQEFRHQYPLSAFAVLYRTNAQSRPFEDALMHAGIPYQLVGGTRFYERKEIKDVLAYLRLLLHPEDQISFQRIINTPTRGIGEVRLRRILEIAATQQIDTLAATRAFFEEAGAGANIRASLKDFCTWTSELRDQIEDIPLGDLAIAVIKKSRYEESLSHSADPTAETRLENLSEFVNLMARHSPQRGGDALQDFLDSVSLVSDADTIDNRHQDRADERDDEDRVLLMTLHTAKGLEFDVVFLPGLEEGLLPHSRCLDDPKSIEEERRLCYVGITRARQQLFLMRANRRFVFGSPRFSLPSRFLKPLLNRAVKKPRQGLQYDYTAEHQQDNPSGMVFHPRYGEGWVVSISHDGDRQFASVRFRDGRTKKFLTAALQRFSRSG